MRKLIVSLVVVALTATAAFAEWLVDFRDNYYGPDGIDGAVVVALEQGITPDLIVENGLLFEDLNPQNLVKALYCAGAEGEDIIAAAEQHGISEIILAAGYAQSVDECADQLADSQAYTPVGLSFSGVPSPGTGGTSFASPSSF